MVKKGKMTGRNFALTIILGIFIAIMVLTLFNLVVSYVYEGPNYEIFCRGAISNPYPIKVSEGVQCTNCTFSKSLQTETDQCYRDGGNPIYNYDNQGCTSSLKECNMCNKELDKAVQIYNRNTFFIFAIIGFILIVAGLFIDVLLIQLITLPAGAFLVIEAAVKNFDNKLYVIITFALLIVSAVYLALKKLK